MFQIRLAVLSAALVAAAFAAAPQTASARFLGGFSIDRSANPTPSTGPWGGVDLCTANLRRWNSLLKQWEFHMASGFDAPSCMANAQIYINLGYSPNPNPGTGFCACHPGFNGMAVASPDGNGPLAGHELSPEAAQVYSEGLLQLRKRYNFDQLAKEQEELLDAVMAADQKGG